MQLSGGDVEIGQELPLKAGEREPEPNLFEYGCIDEAGRVVVTAIIIDTDRFLREARTNNNLVIMLLMKGEVGLISQAKNIDLRVNRGGLIQQSRGSPWVQQFVIRNGACGGIGLRGSRL